MYLSPDDTDCVPLVVKRYIKKNRKIQLLEKVLLI